MTREESSSRTFMPQAHLNLQRFEVIRDICLDFATHSFSCPLLEAVQLLVDVHVVCFRLGMGCASFVIGCAKSLIRLFRGEEGAVNRIVGM
jgi:hypothetical protein